MGESILKSHNVIAAIAVLNLGVSFIDLWCKDEDCSCCDARSHVQAMRRVQATCFHAVNLLLLLAAHTGNSYLIQLYICYTLSFVVVGSVVTIIDFTCRVKHESWWSFAYFILEVVYLFVLCQCLPLLNGYKKDFEE